MTLRLLLVNVFLVCLTGSTVAQLIGDADNGRILAEKVCSECHSLDALELDLPKRKAASFATIANTPGMTPLALSVWFRTPHREMPNIILSKDEQEDLIAFITSLKSTN